MNMKKVTRVEVIDNRGRSYVFDPRQWIGCQVRVETSLQDEGRTLKVFIYVTDPTPTDLTTDGVIRALRAQIKVEERAIAETRARLAALENESSQGGNQEKP